MTKQQVREKAKEISLNDFKIKPFAFFSNVYSNTPFFLYSSI